VLVGSGFLLFWGGAGMNERIIIMVMGGGLALFFWLMIRSLIKSGDVKTSIPYLFLLGKKYGGGEE